MDTLLQSQTLSPGGGPQAARRYRLLLCPLPSDRSAGRGQASPGSQKDWDLGLSLPCRVWGENSDCFHICLATLTVTCEDALDKVVCTSTQ